ncbi:hypothetical protein QZH41_002576 [Actinostola sp. cb2023]|nr:hypothetical protein QZH41_002576 [Actinostola sp. cb2023]
MGAWEKRRTTLRDRDITRQEALPNMRDADQALDLYARSHPQPRVGEEPQWRDFYKPSRAQRTGELLVVGAGTLGAAYAIAKVLWKKKLFPETCVENWCPRIRRMDGKLAAIYYSPQGYWKGLAAIGHLVTAAPVSKDAARAWLEKQALWQIYLPAPRQVPRPRFDVSVPNEVHQADLLPAARSPWTGPEIL